MTTKGYQTLRYCNTLSLGSSKVKFSPEPHSEKNIENVNVHSIVIFSLQQQHVFILFKYSIFEGLVVCSAMIFFICSSLLIIWHTETRRSGAQHVNRHLAIVGRRQTLRRSVKCCGHVSILLCHAGSWHLTILNGVQR